MQRTLIVLILLLSSFCATAIDSIVIKHSAKLNVKSIDIQSRFSLPHDEITQNDLGLNIAVLDESDMQSVVMECDSLVESIGSNCLSGELTWTKKNLHHSAYNHHGIGIFINSEKALLAKLTDYQFKSDDSVVYEYGLAYNYFVNNTNQDGFNFAAHVYRYNDKRIGEAVDNSGINLRVGYQF